MTPETDHPPSNYPPPPTSMHTHPDRATQLLSALTSVTSRIAAANPSSRPIRLVLVSKLHPPSDIHHLHTHPPPQQPLLHFGENYLSELQHKATLLPATIKWHFIGGLQTNKCKALASSVRNLWCVSSVDSVKKADQLDKGRAAALDSTDSPPSSSATDDADADARLLRVHVQINTSGEESKSGVTPAEAAALCRHIRQNCPHLRLIGLMTIGALARSTGGSPAEGNTSENEDYTTLRRCRSDVARALGMEEGRLELSMGMSGDFEDAVRQGSDEVRVGSTVFGARPAKGSLSMEEIERREKAGP